MLNHRHQNVRLTVTIHIPYRRFKQDLLKLRHRQIPLRLKGQATMIDVILKMKGQVATKDVILKSTRRHRFRHQQSFYWRRQVSQIQSFHSSLRPSSWTVSTQSSKFR